MSFKVEAASTGDEAESIWKYGADLLSSLASSFIGRQVTSVFSESSVETKSNSKIEKAAQIKAIHDLIEEVAYRAFAEAVVEMGIREDKISNEQSKNILLRVKNAAHKEMYKPDGYAARRGVILEPCQFSRIMRSVARIIHDRDSKLTQARYGSLSEML